MEIYTSQHCRIRKIFSSFCTDIWNTVDFFYHFYPFPQTCDGRQESCLVSLRVTRTCFLPHSISLFLGPIHSHDVSASSQVVPLSCISGFALSSSLRLESSLDVFLSVSPREIIWPKIKTNTKTLPQIVQRAIKERLAL